MTPDPDNAGWFLSVPDSQGEYLCIDFYWHFVLAVWIPGEGSRKGRWYPHGRQPCDGDGMAKWRPLPRMPLKEPAKMRETTNSRVMEG